MVKEFFGNSEIRRRVLGTEYEYIEGVGRTPEQDSERLSELLCTVLWWGWRLNAWYRVSVDDMETYENRNQWALRLTGWGPLGDGRRQ